MATSTTTRVMSYFFLFDFYNYKNASDDNDLLPESIIYFYPPKEEIKRQKLLDCGEIVAFVQYFKYDLFLCLPKEFSFKKSIVVCEHFGRHCAFLVLSKDRFTIDEANVHLTHILRLSNILYGTFNHIQSIRSDINQIQNYLKETLTPILQHVFNEVRSVRNLFLAIDYAPIKKNDQRCLLHVKHFLTHLQTQYGISHGFFAYEKRILYSTFDVDTTFDIQVILSLERHLPRNVIYIPVKSEIKLRNGVTLIKIYIRRSASLEAKVSTGNCTTTLWLTDSKKSEPIEINPSTGLDQMEPLPSTSVVSSLGYSSSTGTSRRYNSLSPEDPAGSSGEATGFESDLTGDTSPPSTENDGVELPTREKKATSIPIKIQVTPTEFHDSNETVQSKNSPQVRSRSGTINSKYEDSIKLDQDKIENVMFEPIFYHTDIDSCDDCCQDTLIDLPRKTFYRSRRKTITNYSDLNDVEYNNSNEHHEGHGKWGDTPEQNDEVERDGFVLYVQRNSRLIFAGILEENLLSEEYLKKLWGLILTGMADMDRDIQVIPIAGETNRQSTIVKFQFHDNTHQVQYEQISNGTNIYYEIPISDSACMAFNAQMKMNEDSQRKMVGLSRGNDLISINRNLPDRVNFLCRRYQEQH